MITFYILLLIMVALAVALVYNMNMIREEMAIDRLIHQWRKRNKIYGGNNHAS